MSRELVLNMSISVDGFVAGPNGEFDWVFRNSTEESRAWAAAQLAPVSLHVMGRRSYESMADFWPTAENPFAVQMNEVPKAVFSKSGVICPPSFDKTMEAVKEGRVDQKVLDGWQHPRVGGVDLLAEINSLKGEAGGPINALGGASFATSLIAAHLVDVFRLIVHPVILGQGMSIFAGLESPAYLKLEDLKQFDSGIVVKTHRPSWS